MSDKIYSNILYYALCVFAFYLPFSSVNGPFLNLTPAFIALLLVIWLINMKFTDKFNLMKKNKLLLPFILCAGLYLLYIIGLLYSKNLDFGLTDLLLKLPLLLFPLIIFTANPDYWSKKRTMSILKLFTLGSLILLIICVIHSWFLYRQAQYIWYLHYDYAAWFHHPSYSSMYYCFSLVIIVYIFINDKSLLWEKIFGTIALILFAAEIIMIDSRAGIMAFGSVLLIYFFHIIIFKKKLRIYFLVSIFCLFCALAGIYKFLPKDIKMSRTQEAISYVKDNFLSEKNPQEKNIRLLVWHSSYKVATDNLPFGTGTGDIKDELLKQYTKDGYTEAHDKNLNVHCQYLQIFATLGIVGIIVFLSIIFSIFWIGCKTKNILFVVFGLVMGVNFLVESMLEVQIGVMFFCFFFSLLCFACKNKLLKYKEINQN